MSSTADDSKLPKQDLLLKMLGMTQSDNDGQALVAIRKCNALLASAGWTWEKLLAGKITVVADPFASIPTPKRAADVEAPVAPQRPTRVQRPPPAPPPPPPGPSYSVGGRWSSTWSTNPASPPPPRTNAAAGKPEIGSTSINTRRGGGCWCCGDYVPVGDGFIFNPQKHHPRAPDKWSHVCKSCNTSLYPAVGSTPAKAKQPTLPSGIKPNLSSL